VSRGRAALLLFAIGSAVALTAAPARAQGTPRATGRGEVLLFMVDRVSFEQVLSVPAFRRLAQAGGGGLMTTHVPGRAAVATRPNDPERARLATAIVENGTSSPPEGPSLLERALAAAGIPLASEAAGSDAQIDLLQGKDGVLLIQVGSTVAADEEAPYSTPAAVRRATAAALDQAGAMLQRTLASSQAGRVLVLVVTPQPSFEMDQVGDETTGIVMAAGPPGRLLRANGPLRTVTSDSTRQDGLVSNVDVAPTVLSFFGVDLPAEMTGRPVRVTEHGDPLALHRRHLEQRRIRIPVQTGEVVYVALVGTLLILSLLAMGAGARIQGGGGAILRHAMLAATSLMLVVAVSGLLPRLTYPVVVPFLILGTAGLTWLAVRSGWRGAVGPFAVVGALSVAFLLVDGLFGLRAFRTPLLGATMFDGVRFYGLPNAFIAFVLGSALFVAAELPAFSGAVVLFGAGLFTGLPALGANVGGAVTLFAAAGTWWAVRAPWERAGSRDRLVRAGVAVAIPLAGTVLVLLLNRFLPGAPTHAGRFAERTGGHAGSFLSEVWHRLSVGGGQLRDHPSGWLPVVGLPIILALVLWLPAPIRLGFDRWPAWRPVVVAASVAGIVAFLANDTGVAAAAPVFLYALTGLAYPALTAAAAGSDARRPRRGKNAPEGEPVGAT